MNLFARGPEIGMLCAVRNWILMALLICALAGCKNDSPVAPAPSATSAPVAPKPTSAIDEAGQIPRAERGQPQPRLVTLKLLVGTNELTAEISLSNGQVQHGMMWRTNMAEMEGMLFVFPVPHQTAFWMRNTLLPLMPNELYE